MTSTPSDPTPKNKSDIHEPAHVIDSPGMAATETTPTRQSARKRGSERLTPIAEFGLAAFVFAFSAIVCYTDRHVITSDGVSYADLADRYAAGQWSATVNGHWSRFYPFLLSVMLRVFHPSRYAENLYFHAVNLILLVAALVSFHFLLVEIIRWQQIESSELLTISWTPKEFMFLAYALFAYVMRMVSPGYITPDIGVAAASFMATAILLRITRPGEARWLAAILGLLLGIGYLMKSILMVFSFGCLLALFLLLKGRKRIETIAIVAVGLIAVSAPNIIELSGQQGRLTFSESGRLVQMWQADGTSFVDLDPPGHVKGTPKHPPHQIFSHPNAYEFATPIIATYPPWFDPAYWHQGLSPKFDPSGERYALGVTAKYYLSALVLRKGPLLILLAVLLALQLRSGIRFRWHWLIWLVPSLLPLIAYAALFADDRYIGGFLLLALVIMFGSLQLPDNLRSERLFSLVTLIVTCILFAFVVFSTFRHAAHPPENTPGKVAEGIVQGHYVAPGEPVACIGYCFDHYWARLDRLRIVAEVPGQILAVNAAKGPVNTSIVTDADLFWRADPRTRELVLAALAKTGARGVVAINPPQTSDKTGWDQIGTTNYYIKTFPH